LAKYEIDPEDKPLFEELLSLAQRVVDLQYDDDAADDLQMVLNECADFLGIEQTTVNVTTDDQGRITIDIEKPTADLDGGVPSKPRLTIVSNNDPD
jgi:hypothetical protein